MLARRRSIKRRHKFAALSFAFLSKISLFITFFKNYHIHKNNFHDESETTRRNRSSILREPIKRFVCVTFLSLGRSNWLQFGPKKQVSPPAAGEVVWRSWVEQGLIYHEVCNLFLYCTVKFVWFWNGWSSDKLSTVKRLISSYKPPDVCDRCAKGNCSNIISVCEATLYSELFYYFNVSF